jgi:hypothetical protein
MAGPSELVPVPRASGDSARRPAFHRDCRDRHAERLRCPGGMFDRAGIPIGGIQAIVPSIRRVMDAGRAAGMRVVFLTMQFAADLSDAGGPEAPNRIKHRPLGLGEPVDRHAPRRRRDDERLRRVDAPRCLLPRLPLRPVERLHRRAHRGRSHAQQPRRHAPCHPDAVRLGCRVERAARRHVPRVCAGRRERGTLTLD